MTKTSLPINVKSSKNSLQNALLLLVLVVGLFMIYRYVKSIEGEVKILHNHIIELSEKVHNGGGTCTIKDKQNSKSKKSKSIIDKNTNDEENNEDNDEEENNDDESVKSEDITNILRKVIGGENNELDELEDDNTINIMNKIFSNVVQDSIVEDSVQKCTVTEIDEDVENKKSVNVFNIDNEEVSVENKADDVEENEEDDDDDDNNENDRDEEDEDDDDFIEIVNKKNVNNYDKVGLMKKTNEELKNLLKEKNLPTKGAKNELVERLLSS